MNSSPYRPRRRRASVPPSTMEQSPPRTRGNSPASSTPPIASASRGVHAAIACAFSVPVSASRSGWYGARPPAPPAARRSAPPAPVPAGARAVHPPPSASVPGRTAPRGWRSAVSAIPFLHPFRVSPCAVKQPRIGSRATVPSRASPARGEPEAPSAWRPRPAGEASPTGRGRTAPSGSRVPLVPPVAPVAAVALGQKDDPRQVLRALVAQLDGRVQPRRGAVGRAPGSGRPSRTPRSSAGAARSPGPSSRGSRRRTTGSPRTPRPGARRPAAPARSPAPPSRCVDRVPSLHAVVVHALRASAAAPPARRASAAAGARTSPVTSSVHAPPRRRVPQRHRAGR